MNERLVNERLEKLMLMWMWCEMTVLYGGTVGTLEYFGVGQAKRFIH